MNANPSLPPDLAGASMGMYRCGTLVYTRLRLASLFFWLLWGDFCYVLMESVVPSVLPLKFQSLHASNSSIGLILVTIPNIINTVCNPIISFRSDRFRSRWGRRIPFILCTLPFLVICLLALGFADDLALWLRGLFAQVSQGLSPDAAAVAVIGGIMILFSFFNTFVNSVFWYLFNDVVPPLLLARFMSWFRLMSLGATFLYNLLIFPLAGTHFREILVGASLLYFFGFGLMCFKVKEGEYPPADDQVAGGGFLSAVKTFFVECHSHWHYWYVFLGTAAASFGGAIATFSLFFLQGTGLDLAQIGRLNSATSLASALLIVFSGWLADRFHPVRIVLLGQCLATLILVPATGVFLFWHPPSNVAFWAWMVIKVVIGAPVGALIGMGDPPMYMRLFPRAQYGQFCSANAMWRSLGAIVGGLLAGVYLDLVRRYAHVPNIYAFIPVWQWVCSLPVVYMAYKLFKSWKHYGGDSAYEPPGVSPANILRANVPPSLAAAGASDANHTIESAIASERIDQPRR